MIANNTKLLAFRNSAAKRDQQGQHGHVDLDDTVCGRGHYCLGRKLRPPPLEPDALHIDLNVSNPVSANLVLTARFQGVCNENASHSGNCRRRKGRQPRQTLNGSVTDSKTYGGNVTHVFVFHGRPGLKSSRLLFNGSIFTSSRNFEAGGVSLPTVNLTTRASNDANTSQGAANSFNVSAGSVSLTNESASNTSPQEDETAGSDFAGSTSETVGTFSDTPDTIGDKGFVAAMLTASLMPNTTQSGDDNKPNTTVSTQESAQLNPRLDNASNSLSPTFNSSNGTGLPPRSGFQASTTRTVNVPNAAKQNHSQARMASSDSLRVTSSPTTTAPGTPGNTTHQLHGTSHRRRNVKSTGAWSQIIRNARPPTSVPGPRPDEAGSSSNLAQGVKAGAGAKQNGIEHEVQPIYLTGRNQSTPLPSSKIAALYVNDTEETTTFAHTRRSTFLSNVNGSHPTSPKAPPLCECNCDCMKPVTRSGSRSRSDNHTKSHPGDNAEQSLDQMFETNEFDEFEASRALQAARRSLRIAEGNLRDAQAHRDAQAAQVAVRGEAVCFFNLNRIAKMNTQHESLPKCCVLCLNRCLCCCVGA